MKKISFFALFLIAHISLFAQYDGPVAPNYKEIEKNIANSASGLLYQNLMDKYLAGDSTMSINEQRHLYYGYVFNDNYNPVDETDYNSKLGSVLRKQHLSNDDFIEIAKYANLLLDQDPFNMRALNAQLIVFAQTNDVASYRKTAVKRNIVERAIVSSGDGMSKKNAYYVIKVAHEYDILGFLGYKYGGSEQLEKGGKCNSLTVAKNPFGVEKVYFDISPVLRYASKKGKQKI